MSVMQNRSNSVRTINAVLSATTNFYNGVKAQEVRRANGMFVLQPMAGTSHVTSRENVTIKYKKMDNPNNPLCCFYISGRTEAARIERGLLEQTGRVWNDEAACRSVRQGNGPVLDRRGRFSGSDAHHWLGGKRTTTLDVCDLYKARRYWSIRWLNRPKWVFRLKWPSSLKIRSRCVWRRASCATRGLGCPGPSPATVPIWLPERLFHSKPKCCRNFPESIDWWPVLIRSSLLKSQDPPKFPSANKSFSHSFLSLLFLSFSHLHIYRMLMPLLSPSMI